MSEIRGDVNALVAQVHRRAEQRALALETQTSAQVEQIESEGEARAAALEAELIEMARVASRDVRGRRLAVADLRRRRRRIEAREARLERVWTGAAAELRRREGGSDTRGALAALARDAGHRLGGDEVQIRLDAGRLAQVTAQDVAGWSDAAGPRLILDPRPIERGHGVIASAGRVSVDATFEGRLARARERLRDEIAGLLSEKPTVGTT